jgi:glycosyltransferase involved in cell wall biosynthesis
MARAADPIRVLRVIARMNAGGPAHHVSLLTGGLDRSRYVSRLLTGSVGPGEPSLQHLAAERGGTATNVAGLSPSVSPIGDLRAFVALLGHMHRFQPDVVHTHTAKAGTLGRLAARVALGGRVVVVHTYHGHVLTGYFSPAVAALYRLVERWLGRLSDCLVTVTDANLRELVSLGVAARCRFRTIPLGLDLEPFAAVESGSGGFRREVGVGADEVLAVFVGRLVEVKRVDVLLRGLAAARGEGARIRLALVGEGPLRSGLETLRDELGLGPFVRFAGFRDDLPYVFADADLAVLSSDHEGTPVSLIEAAAAGVPAVATDVGGVSDIVRPETGITVPRRDPAALGRALAALARDADARARLGAAARRHATGSYSSARLIRDIDALYTELLSARRAERSA